ncbi:MAG: dienelactone hydrolase family protein, partial [Actinomycetota bacterium]|nr:dienelactone hydrolase family protein [Actinomycetota bacterium]
GLAAAAVFYGSSPSPEQARRVACPLRGFYGEDDPRIVSGLPAFAQALDAAGADHELRIYPGAGHAFFNDTRPSYRPDAARDAWARTLGFFAEALGPAPTVAPAEPGGARDGS